jgi:hypothetical protein
MSATARGEGFRILGLAVLIASTVGAYIALRSISGAGDEGRLRPYQALAGTLPETDRQMFAALHVSVLGAESFRARTGRWPEPGDLASGEPAAFADDGGYRWRLGRQTVVTQYLGLPDRPSDPAWLVVFQEPIPGAPPDPAPNDEEHHRLPDGTVLHLYFWMHRVGGRIAPEFVPSPESSGWMQMLYAPSNPIRPTVAPAVVLTTVSSGS